MSSVLTVSQINTYLKSVIDGDYNLKNIYVTGEISNFTNHYRTGHFYFTLKDENSLIKAVMFRSAAQRVRFEIENGMKVLIRASVSVYERDGVYQLYCEDIIPEGIGELTVAFEQTKKKLSDLGIFSEEHKKPLPKFPKRIGVITSPTGAAIQDILTVLERRFPFAEVVFEPVQVQGESASGQIAAAIRKFDEKKACDVLIVGRGGGSIEDLWAFNEEIVAYAIYSCSIPVISAVGHETDFTIADFVADMRAPTPSAAAEVAVPDYRELLYSIDKLLDSITDSVCSVLSSYQLRLSNMEKRITNRSPENNIHIYEQYLASFSKKIKDDMNNKISVFDSALLHYAARLEGVSPMKVLMRGYSIVSDNNDIVVKSVKNISEGQTLNVLLADGKLKCQVSEVLLDDVTDTKQ